MTNPSLHTCIEKRDFDGIEAALKAGADPNATNDKGMRPLHVFARKYEQKSPKVTQALFLLIGYGADAGLRAELKIDSRDKQPLPEDLAGDEFTASWLSAWRGYPALCAQDPSLNLAGAFGLTAAHLAAIRGDVGEIARQIDGGGELSLPATGMDGDTAALLAAEGGHRDVLREIMACGDSWAYEASAEGSNIFHKAIMSGDMETVRLVHQEYGCVETSKLMYMKPDQYGWTPAHEAAQGGMDGALAILIRRGLSDVLDAENTAEGTPLMVAARAGRASTCRMLIKERANLNHIGSHIGSVLYEGPLVNAIRSGDPETLKVILEHKPQTQVNDGVGAEVGEYHAQLLGVAERSVKIRKGDPQAEEVLSILTEHYREDREAADKLAATQAQRAVQSGTALPGMTP